jgi:hypothetical protein
MPAVNENSQLHSARAANIVHRIEGGPDRPPAIEDIVDEHDDLVVDAISGDLCREQRTCGRTPEVISIHRDVE